MAKRKHKNPYGYVNEQKVHLITIAKNGRATVNKRGFYAKVHIDNSRGKVIEITPRGTRHTTRYPYWAVYLPVEDKKRDLQAKLRMFKRVNDAYDDVIAATNKYNKLVQGYTDQKINLRTA